MQPSVPVTATATFCATIVDQWATLGVTSAFVAPGSRSTPLALALAASDDFVVNVFHDERTAAFAALGNALANEQPALILCTSGTAAAHFYAAVIEADISCVPLLVCTADRPPELWDIGAPQTINQTRLYGESVRSFIEPGPPEDSAPSTWRQLAVTSYEQSRWPQPGPVHLNLSFRDPLVGQPEDLPEPLVRTVRELRAARDSTPTASANDGAALAARCLDNAGNPRNGIIVAGRGQSDAASVIELSTCLGWPILADYRSGTRSQPASIRHFDTLLRQSDFAQTHQPDVILRLGEITSSKSTSQWIAASAAEVIAAMPWGRKIDPELVEPEFLPEAGLLEEALASLDRSHPQLEANTSWTELWQAADESANHAIRSEIENHAGLAEPAVARAVVCGIPSGGALVVSSSMPVRDVEWFGEHRDDISVYSNRGANGIDGVVSTAIGVALSGVPTACLIGDVAFLHDASALVALARRPIDLTLVVTNNDGGGIFSFLPQNDLLQIDRYEQLFGTPHGTDLEALAAANKLRVRPWATPSGPIVDTGTGVQVLVAHSDRTSNQELHDNIVAAVGQALTS